MVYGFFNVEFLKLNIPPYSYQNGFSMKATGQIAPPGEAVCYGTIPFAHSYTTV